MSLELRVETLGEEHIDSHVQLSRAEFGDGPAASNPDHLRWKFLQNPQGPSVGIHLYRNDVLVGRMLALARQFLYRGKLYRAAHIVDFLVHPHERGMKALFQLVTGLKRLPGFDLLLIMAPNPAGAAVWDKFVKMKAYFDLDVTVAPCRPAAILRSAGKLNCGPMTPVLDWMWRTPMNAWLMALSLTTDATMDETWPTITEMQQMLSSGWGDKVIGLRSPEYLDWRYRSSPVANYNVTFLRERGELRGYCVTRRTTYEGLDSEFLVDVFGSPQMSPKKWRRAASRQVLRASRNRAQMAMFLGNTEWGPSVALRKLPFVSVPKRILPRKTSVYAEWLTGEAFDIGRGNFYLTLGDSDVI
jgi:hypothetical protein